MNHRFSLVFALVCGLVLAPVLMPLMVTEVAGEDGGSDGQSPDMIEIFADDAIEWNQEDQVYVARGGAQALQENLSVEANVLTAHYHQGEQGNARVWRLNAEGEVRIRDERSLTTGQHGLYDVDRDILVLTGPPLTLVSGSDRVEARQSLEYWRGKGLAVARGEAVALREDKTVAADVLSAYFDADAEDEDRALQRIEASGNVEITTPLETVQAQSGVYDVDTGIVSVAGSVRILRENNRLAGNYGEVDLNTGVSRLLAAPPDGGGESGPPGKVRVLIEAGD